MAGETQAPHPAALRLHCEGPALHVVRRRAAALADGHGARNRRRGEEVGPAAQETESLA